MSYVNVKMVEAGFLNHEEGCIEGTEVKENFRILKVCICKYHVPL